MMNIVIKDTLSESDVNGVLPNEQYCEDFFENEKCSREGHEHYDFTEASDAANEDLWELLEMSEAEWAEASQDGFLIF